MRKKLSAANPLKTVLTAGLILAVLIAWGLVFFALFWGRGSPFAGRSIEHTFAQNLMDYDFFNAPKLVLDGENPNEIERRLSELQIQAGRVEEHLSVLKRRRELALIDRRYIAGYAKAAEEAAQAFPYSAPLAAVAAEAALLDGAPLSEDSLTLLKTYASGMTQNRFDLLGLSLHILAGNLASPVLAAGNPAIGNLLSLDLADFPEQIQRDLHVNEFLLSAYRGNIGEATQKLNELLSEGNRQDILMGAEFFYDHNFPHRAAELFLMLGGDENNARAADALVLAGEIPGARNIWLALSSPSPTGENLSRQASVRNTYNLAASSPNQAEETAWLERLFSQQQEYGDMLGTYSIIRYTRLLDESRSIAILDDESMRQNPLLDLELLRRRLETLPHIRITAEIWLLASRHSGDEAVHEWAAWYFEHQRLFGELDHLLLEAGRNGMAGSWYNLHRGLAFIRDGNIAEGERVLREARSPGARLPNTPSTEDWRIYANLGRIQESRRSLSSALEYYENAAALVIEKPDAAQLQIRIGRNLEALGRLSESRRAFERALELDPYNINIRRLVRSFNTDHL